MKKIIFLILIILLMTSIVNASVNYDIVIKNGVVYDPQSDKFLEGYNIGILSDKIEIITRDDITGSNIIDATNRIIMPSFIDSFQRHFGSVFDGFRIKDGVTTSIFTSDEGYNSFLANNSENISYINRILIYDISKKLPSDDKDDIKSFEELIMKNIADGYAGIYYKPTNTSFELDLNFLSSDYPLYLDLSNIDEIEIINYIKAYRDREKNPRPIHLLASNYYFNIIDDIISFSETDELFTFGGHIFSYINIKPNLEQEYRKEQFIGKTTIDQKAGNIFDFDNSYINYEDTLAVTGLNSEDTIEKMIGSNGFVPESFDLYPGSVMSTADANTFISLFKKGYDKKEQLPFKALTINPIANFKSVDSPLINKGKIEFGADADIVIIDPSSITPHSSMTEQVHPSHGVTHVIREGMLIINDREFVPSAPKARWIKRNHLPYEFLNDFSIKTKHKKAAELNAVKFKNKNYLSLYDISQYLNILYAEDGGHVTIGNLIKMDIGSNYYSVGTTKNEIAEGLILINGGIYLEENSLKSLLRDFFEIEIEENKISFKNGDKYSLLDTSAPSSNMNVNTNTTNILLSYIISIGLLVVFILFLNYNKNKSKANRKE